MEHGRDAVHANGELGRGVAPDRDGRIDWGIPDLSRADAVVPGHESRHPEVTGAIGKSRKLGADERHSAVGHGLAGVAVHELAREHAGRIRADFRGRMGDERQVSVALKHHIDASVNEHPAERGGHCDVIGFHRHSRADWDGLRAKGCLESRTIGDRLDGHAERNADEGERDAALEGGRAAGIHTLAIRLSDRVEGGPLTRSGVGVGAGGGLAGTSLLRLEHERQASRARNRGKSHGYETAHTRPGRH